MVQNKFYDENWKNASLALRNSTDLFCRGSRRYVAFANLVSPEIVAKGINTLTRKNSHSVLQVAGVRTCAQKRDWVSWAGFSEKRNPGEPVWRPPNQENFESAMDLDISHDGKRDPGGKRSWFAEKRLWLQCTVMSVGLSRWLNLMPLFHCVLQPKCLLGKLDNPNLRSVSSFSH